MSEVRVREALEALEEIEEGWVTFEGVAPGRFLEVRTDYGSEELTYNMGAAVANSFAELFVWLARRGIEPDQVDRFEDGLVALASVPRRDLETMVAEVHELCRMLGLEEGGRLAWRLTDDSPSTGKPPPARKATPKPVAENAGESPSSATSVLGCLGLQAVALFVFYLLLSAAGAVAFRIPIVLAPFYYVGRLVGEGIGLSWAASVVVGIAILLVPLNFLWWPERKAKRG